MLSRALRSFDVKKDILHSRGDNDWRGSGRKHFGKRARVACRRSGALKDIRSYTHNKLGVFFFENETAALAAVCKEQTM